MKTTGKALVHNSGAVMLEYLLVAMVLVILWTTVDFVMARFGEHQNEYTYSISQP